MKTARFLCKAAALAVLGAGLAGCGNTAHPPVDKQRAENAIKAIQADPHMLPKQKAGMIAEIQKQIH